MQLFNQKEKALWQQVHTLIVAPRDHLVNVRDKWLQHCKMTIVRYARMMLNPDKQVDGLFMLLAAYKFTAHLAMVHMDGIWSTQSDGAFRQLNLMLVQTTDGFC